MDRIVRLLQRQDIAELNRIFDGVTWSESSGHVVAQFGTANSIQRLPEVWVKMFGKSNIAEPRDFWDRVEGRVQFVIRGIHAIAPDEMSYSSFDPPVSTLTLTICRGRATTNFELLPTMIIVN